MVERAKEKETADEISKIQTSLPDDLSAGDDLVHRVSGQTASRICRFRDP
jgi:hypothetical protein